MRVLTPELQALGVADVVSIDAEYIAQRGWHVTPVCFCAKSLITKKTWRLWCYGKRQRKRCPFPKDARILFLSYSALAEWGFYLAMGWELPLTIIDLFAEMCLRENGRKDRHGSKFRPSLLYAMRHYGLDAITAAEKQTMRQRIIAGGPYSAKAQEDILEYCMTDVIDLEKLFPKMLPEMNIYQAVQRGAHTRACAASEFNGIPIDVPVYRDLQAKWPRIRSIVPMAVESEHKYGVYTLDKRNRAHWSRDGFTALVYRLGAQGTWPRTPTKKFSTSDEVLKRQAARYPQLRSLREVKKTLEELDNFDLPLGPDGRIHCDARPWAAVTGRNYPLVRDFLFARSKWTRHLVKPECKTALAYVDLRACEFGIAAARSRDPVMIASYVSGEDVYLRLARLAGAVPEGATKQSHPHERSLFKVAMLAAGYGQKPAGFAASVGCSLQKAEMVHADLRRIYQKFFDWREEQVAIAVAKGEMVSYLGWRVPVHWWTSKRFLYNFPIQSAGADILRTAGALMCDGGIRILALVQDAVLIESTPDRIKKSVKFVQECWRRASASVLEDGFELESDVEIVRWPHTFNPDKGEEDESKTTWALLMTLRKKIRVNHDAPK